MTTIGIIDCGISNLTSIANALKSLSIESRVVRSVGVLGDVSHIILPGVGTFHQGIRNLNECGWPEAILARVEAGIPLLGICLGMQLLAEAGSEVRETKGLGLIGGRVVPIPRTDPDLRLPHIGWNEAAPVRESRLWSGIPDGSAFYFVHGYAYGPDVPAEQVAAVTEYGSRVVAAVERDNVFGVQFHPEKSQKLGLKLLKNFSTLC